MSISNKTLSKSDYKLIILSLLGGGIEVFDFIIFVFLSTIIADVFFPESTPEWIRLMESLAIFSIGYLARPLGGILIAHYSDQYGRKHMFNFTVLFMAIPCLAIGLLPGFNQIGYWAPVLLLIARIIQGAALGGEVPNAWVFVAEHTPEIYRGTALGLLQAGLSFGYMIGALTISLITTLFSTDEMRDWAWRIPFLIGGSLGFITIWLRRWLNETPAFIAMNNKKRGNKALPLKIIVKDYRKQSIPAFILTGLLTSSVIMSVVVFPIIIQKCWGLDSATTFKISCAGIFSLNIGCIIAGRIADHIGAWKAATLYSIILTIGVVSSVIFMNDNIFRIVICYVFLGLCSGIVGIVPTIMVGLFPTEVKVTGISLVYNSSYSILSSVLPLFIVNSYRTSPWSLALFSFIVSLIGLITITIYRKNVN